jgi:hypothetical protein
MTTNFDVLRIDIKDRLGVLLLRDLPHAPTTSFSRSVSTPEQFILDTFQINLLPDWKNKADLRIIYDILDYQQQVWIYNAFSNQLLFVGLIVDRPSDMNNKGIAGEDIRWLFTKRRLAHFEFIEGTVQTSLEYLSKFWQPVFLDDFPNLSNWVPFLGGWNATQNQLIATVGTIDGATDNGIYHEYPVDPTPFIWEISLSSASLSETRLVRLSLTTIAGPSELALEISHIPNDDGHLFRLFFNGLTKTTEIFQTDHRAPVDTLLNIQIWVLASTLEIWLNGIQIMLEASIHNIIGGTAYRFLLEAENQQVFEQAFRWTKQEYMTLDLNSTKAASVTEQEFQQDTHQSALDYYFTTFELESRANYLQTGPPHQLEVGDFVGEDKSSYIIFERGKNLSKLMSPSTAQKLATCIDLFGQGQHTNQTLAKAYSIPAINLYGVIEEQVNDSRITVPATARQKSKSILNTRSGGIVSMTATIMEKEETRGRWDVGDIVQVIDKAQSIDRPARVLKVQVTEATPEVQVTFDKLPFSQLSETSKHDDQIADIYRLTKGDTAKEVFQIDNSTLWIDSGDTRFKYENDASAVTAPTFTFWQSAVANAATGAYNNRLDFVNINASFVNLQFFSSGIKIFCRKDSNLASMDITIDGGLVATVSLNSGGRTDRVLVYTNNALVSGFHSLKLQRAGAADLNLFMDIDAVRLGGWYTSIVIESRSVDDAMIAWAISNQATPVKVVIDNIDRTVALGGPAPGFLGDQEINALQFLSKPGSHSIEFVNDDHTLDDLYLEATITVVGLV